MDGRFKQISGEFQAVHTEIQALRRTLLAETQRLDTRRDSLESRLAPTRDSHTPGRGRSEDTGYSQVSTACNTR